MPRATKTELEWAYALTREKFLAHVNERSPIRADDWKRYMDDIFELILKDEAPIYEPKMNAYLEEAVAKYLHPSDDYISLTEIARKFDAENPSYLIQSWLRSRNTVELLAEWERNNNPAFNESAYQDLLAETKKATVYADTKEMDRYDKCNRHHLKAGQRRWDDGPSPYRM